MKFIELENDIYINLDHVVSISFTDRDSTWVRYIGISFILTTGEEFRWFKTDKERDKFLQKIEFHFGGWL